MMSQDPQRLSVLDLPPEILTTILLFLPVHSILRCKRVNHYLANLISNCAEIQYSLCARLATQLDNPKCPLSAKERFSQLSARESRWEEMTINFQKSIKVPFLTSGIYDLTSGVYLLGDASRMALHYTYLPNRPDEEVVWKELRTEQTIIDMGFCVYEHDLLAVITTQPRRHHAGSRATDNVEVLYEIRLQLHQVSTGAPHPEAVQPVISVMSARWERPGVGIEIVGDNLVLILSHYEHQFKPDDHVFIYHWKTGKLKMQFSAPYQSYSGLLFLTTDTILLPNANLGRLEYWKIPEGEASVTVPQPFFSLALPTLNGSRFFAENRVFGHISCRADPNPAKSFRYASNPFIADPQHAIAIFTVHIRSDNGAQPGFAAHLNRPSSFVFFVHRSSLLTCLQKFPDAISQNAFQQPSPVPYSQWGPPICRWFAAEAFPTRWITTTAGQRCIIIPDVNLDSETAPIILLNFNQTDVQRLSVLEKQEREARIRAIRRRRRLARRQKKQGKGKQSRKSSIFNFFAPQIGGTAIQIGGQEESVDEDAYLALSDDSDHDSDLDYLDSMSSSLDLDKPKQKVKAMAREKDPLDDHTRCFHGVVYSSLPYTVYSSTEQYDYHGVLLDEERILGLSSNYVQRITTVDILHIG